MLRRLAASPSKSLLVMTCAFVAGVAAHAWDERAWVTFLPWFAAPALLAALLLCIALLAAAARLPRIRLALFAFGLFATGIARFDAVLAGRVIYAAPPVKSARYVGIVSGIPEATVAGTVIEMRDVALADGPAVGEVQMQYRLPLTAATGDTLAWSCAMRVRPRDGSLWCTPFALPETLGRRNPYDPARLLAAFKFRVRAVIGRLLPEPDASVVLGLLIGDDGGLPQGIVDGFRRTGTSHLMAVSGSNVQQVLEAAFAIAALLCVRRRRAIAGVAALLVGFTLLTGAQASVIRAAVMGGFGLAAAAIGRRNAGLGALLLAAAGMLWFDPLLLRHDVGFRLSFAAVAGLRSYGKIFARLLGREDGLGLKQALGETLAASVATIPISLHDFGTLPLGSPLANIAVVPFVPMIMVSGTLALALGAAWLPLAAPLAFVTGAFCRAMVGTVMAFSRVSPVVHYQAPFAVAALLYAWLIVLRLAL